MPPEEDWATEIGNVHYEIADVLPCGFWIDKQTDKHTYYSSS